MALGDSIFKKGFRVFLAGRCCPTVATVAIVACDCTETTSDLACRMADNEDELTRTPDREAVNPAPATPAGPSAAASSIRVIRAVQPIPYYQDRSEWREEHVLDKIWTANRARPGPAARSKRARSGIIEERLWHGSDVFKTAEVMRVLDIIGGVLHGDARLDVSGQEFNNMRTAFAKPLVNTSPPIRHPNQAICMLIDDSLVRGTQYLSVDQSGYLKLVLAYDSRDSEIQAPTVGNIQEMGHRFVLWSVFGPPPSANMVCMHYCNNKKCLNPMHLVWGNQSENLNDAVGHTRGPAQRAADRICERMRQINLESGYTSE